MNQKIYEHDILNLAKSERRQRTESRNDLVNRINRKQKETAEQMSNQPPEQRISMDNAGLTLANKMKLKNYTSYHKKKLSPDDGVPFTAQEALKHDRELGRLLLPTGDLPEEGWTILYVHKYSIEALRKYGNDLIGLDAIFKLIANSNPLWTFTIVLKKFEEDHKREFSTGFPIAIAIAQYNRQEYLELIIGALKKFVQAVIPHWSPTFMIDKDLVEMNSITSNGFLFDLCTFHYRKTHIEKIAEHFGSRNVESAVFWMRILFKFERAEDNSQASKLIKELTEADFYGKDNVMRKYLLEYWLSDDILTKWTDVGRLNREGLGNTNNYSESQLRKLLRNFFQSKRSNGLDTVLNLISKDIIPDTEKKFTDFSISSYNDYPITTDQRKLAAAIKKASETPPNYIRRVTSSLLYVQSARFQDQKIEYRVSSKPYRCDCFHFMTTGKLTCSHIMILYLENKELPDWKVAALKEQASDSQRRSDQHAKWRRSKKELFSDFESDDSDDDSDAEDSANLTSQDPESEERRRNLEFISGKIHGSQAFVPPQGKGGRRTKRTQRRAIFTELERQYSLDPANFFNKKIEPLRDTFNSRTVVSDGTHSDADSVSANQSDVIHNSREPSSDDKEEESASEVAFPEPDNEEVVSSQTIVRRSQGHLMQEVSLGIVELGKRERKPKNYGNDYTTL